MRRAALLLATLAIGGLALAARADAYVYYGNYGTGSVGRFNQNYPSRRPLRFHPERVRGGRGLRGGRGQHLHLLDEPLDRHDRARHARCHERQPKLHHPKPAACCGGGQRPVHLLDEPSHPASDRPRAHQRRSEQRQPELHLRPEHQHRGNRGRRQAHLLGRSREPQRHPPRSDAPTSAARPSTRTSSLAAAATAPTTASRSTPSTSTGRTAARSPGPVRSAARTSTAVGSSWASSRPRVTPSALRSTPRTSTGRTAQRTRTEPSDQRSGAPTLTARRPTRSGSSTGWEANTAAPRSWPSTRCPRPAPAATRRSPARDGRTSCAGRTTTT